MKRKVHFDEVIAVLVAMKTYSPDLPDPTILFYLKEKKRRSLCRALIIAETNKELSDRPFLELLDALEALPIEWPANTGSFIRQFHEIVQGKTPTIKTVDLSKSDEVELEPLAPTKPTPRA